MAQLALRNIFHKWNAVVGLDNKQLINNTKKPYGEAPIDIMQRQVKKILLTRCGILELEN